MKSEFLEYLNSLISAGEVPGLYTRVKKYLSVVYSADNKHPKF